VALSFVGAQLDYVQPVAEPRQVRCFCDAVQEVEL